MCVYSYFLRQYLITLGTEHSMYVCALCVCAYLYFVSQYLVRLRRHHIMSMRYVCLREFFFLPQLVPDYICLCALSPLFSVISHVSSTKQHIKLNLPMVKG